MSFNNLKKYKYVNIALPILVFLLSCGLLVFITNSLHIVSDSSRNNFAYTVKIRNASEEIDKIVERAGVNISVTSDIIQKTYDISKLHNKAYNAAYLRNIDVLIKSMLTNSPGVNGSWFQVNVDLPFSPTNYAWYTIKDEKISNYKAILEKESPEPRILDPEIDPYYFEAVENKNLTWSDIYVDPDSKVSMLTLSNPIYKKGQLIGVVGIDISTENLQDALKNMQAVFKGSEIFLLDKNDEVILSQLVDNQKTSSVESHINKLFRGHNGDEGMAQYAENGRIKTAIKFGLSNKYKVVITFQNSKLFSGFDRLFNSIYFIFAIMVALAITAIINKNKITKINKTLENEKQRLRTIIDSSPNMILIKDLNGTYTDCNQKFLDFMEVEKDEFIGKGDSDFFTEAEIIDIQRNDEMVIKTNEMVVQESCYLNKSGKKVCVEKYLVPLLNAKQEVIGILINGFDVTIRTQEQEFLEQAKDAAERATSMKSSFLANMSHEIRTPLNGVLGFIQLLKETNTTEEQNEFITDAEKSSEVLINIINDILDFSKIEADKLKIDNISFDVRSVVEDVTLVATANAEAKGIDVSALICSDVPQRVFGDPGRIKQIFNNIIGNAIKFTNAGDIIISAKQVSQDDENIIISFEVKDTGIGIEKDKLDDIFEAFTQADISTTRKFGGTGLGLAICKKLVELMNGELKVESIIGEGSAFVFTMPFKKDLCTESKIEPSTNALRGKQILLITNNLTDIKVVNYYLNELECAIHDAHSIEEALKVISSENISVVLIDHKMQNIDEKELSSTLKSKKISKNIPLILYTSLAKRGDSALAKEKGFTGYLTKPIKKNDLIETLSMAINNKNMEHFITKHVVKEHKFNTKAKILIVEDSELNYKLLFKVLSNHGLSCDLAINGEDAVEAFKLKKYDLILMDCQMPVLDGYKTTKEIRNIETGLTHTPIVAMTASVSIRDERKCLAAGMDDYVSKPINIETFLNTISKYITLNRKNGKKIIAVNGADEIEKIVNEMSSELEFSKNEAIELFTEYLAYLPEAISELEKAANLNDFEELKKIAHKLKGSSSNLRIEIITKLSKSIEAEAANQNKEICLGEIVEMKKHLEYLNDLLLKFING